LIAGGHDRELGELEAESVAFVVMAALVTGYAEIARGTLNAARFTPRDLVVPTLQVGCGALAIANNHPSQDPSPSRADRQVTAVLRDACRIVGVTLLDHVIVTDSAYYTFKEAEGWDE
jgi:DNA repair protein RadC